MLQSKITPLSKEDILQAQLLRVVALTLATWNNRDHGSSADTIVDEAKAFETYILKGRSA